MARVKFFIKNNWAREAQWTGGWSIVCPCRGKGVTFNINCQMRVKSGKTWSWIWLIRAASGWRYNISFLWLIQNTAQTMSSEMEIAMHCRELYGDRIYTLQPLVIEIVFTLFYILSALVRFRERNLGIVKHRLVARHQNYWVIGKCSALFYSEENQPQKHFLKPPITLKRTKISSGRTEQNMLSNEIGNKSYIFSIKPHQQNM